MARFVLLLRGINVGRAKRVPMAELRELLAGLGYDGVSTLLNSGNALFDGPGRGVDRHARAIRSAIQGRFGFDVPAVVVAARDFLAAIAENPIVVPEAEHPRLLAIFAADPATLARVAHVESKLGPAERLHLGERAAYLHCPGGLLDSAAATALLGGLGDAAVTTRNWATVLKIQARLHHGA